MKLLTPAVFAAPRTAHLVPQTNALSVTSATAAAEQSQAGSSHGYSARTAASMLSFSGRLPPTVAADTKNPAYWRGDIPPS